MEPMQVNVTKFEKSRDGLGDFFRDRAKKLPDGINVSIGYLPDKGKVKFEVWSYQPDKSHVSGAKETLEKDYGLSFGPVLQSGRTANYYSTRQEMSAAEFVSLVKKIDPKVDPKLIDAFNEDFKALEGKRQRDHDREQKPLPKEVTDQLSSKFEAAAGDLLAFYPEATPPVGGAYGLFSEARTQVRAGERLDALDTVKKAVVAFDDEAKDGKNPEAVAKVKMHLVGLQGILEEAVETPVEGNGPAPGSRRRGQQVQHPFP